MSPTERLKALAKDDVQVWYPFTIDRDENPFEYEEFLALDPTMIHRFGRSEFKIEHVTDSHIYTMYRPLED